MQVNLSGVVDASKASVLNADGKSNLTGVLKGETGAALRSDADVDHQLLLFITFREAVKIRGVSFTASPAATDAKSSGPKVVKLFVNSTNLDFDGAAADPATQAVSMHHRGGCECPELMSLSPLF